MVDKKVDTRSDVGFRVPFLFIFQCKLSFNVRKSFTHSQACTSEMKKINFVLDFNKISNYCRVYTFSKADKSNYVHV
jgi:hypothetical protein